MKKKVFIDTDIILDVALNRKEFINNSKNILALTENSFILGYTSSVVVSNLYYIIRKLSGDEVARNFIINLLKYITILSVDQFDIENALKSEFSDFEDVIQFSVPNKNHCDIIATRNIEDFKLSSIPVYLTDEVVKMYQEIL